MFSKLRAGLCILSACIAMPVTAQEQQPGAATWITLGTGGGPLLRVERSGPANALVVGGDVTIFDAGEGVIRGIAKAGLRLGQVRTVVISHLHPDHMSGLAALISLRWQVAATSPLTIVGPQGTPELVAGIIAAMKPVEETALAGERAAASPAAWVKTQLLACSGETVPIGAGNLTAVRNSHFIQSDRTESPAATSCSFRIDAGGRSIVYTGDTGPSAAVVSLAKGADLLVSEAIDLDAAMSIVTQQAPNLSPAQRADVQWHLEAHHLTPEQVGEIAREADVKEVVLTHLVPGADGENASVYASRVQAAFTGRVRVASDGDRF